MPIQETGPQQDREEYLKKEAARYADGQQEKPLAHTVDEGIVSASGLKKKGSTLGVPLLSLESEIVIEKGRRDDVLSGELTQRQKEVVDLRYGSSSVTHRQIAERLGVSRRAVTKRDNRAVYELAQRVGLVKRKPFVVEFIGDEKTLNFEEKGKFYVVTNVDTGETIGNIRKTITMRNIELKHGRDSRSIIEIIIDLYYQQGLSQKALGEKLGINPSTVVRWMNVFGLPVKTVEEVKWKERKIMIKTSGLPSETASTIDSPEKALYVQLSSANFLRGLTEKQRTILHLRYGQNLSVSEAAKMLNISPSAVRNSVRGAFKAARPYLSWKNRNSGNPV